MRKLNQVKLDFTSMKKKALKDAAKEALQQGLPIYRVAEQLGYSDSSAFIKAFKRWTGDLPTAHAKK